MAETLQCLQALGRVWCVHVRTACAWQSLWQNVAGKSVANCPAGSARVLPAFCTHIQLGRTAPSCAHTRIQMFPSAGAMNTEPGSSEGPKKTGRPPDSITGHYTKDLTKPKKNNRYWWICKHCKASLVGRNDSLQKHVLSECRAVPQELRVKEIRRITEESGPVPKKLRGLTGGSSADQGTLSGFVDSGLSAGISQQANKELLRTCATSGISFLLVDNPHFRRLLALLRPSYVLPSAHSLHTVFPDSSPASLLRGTKQRSLSANVLRRSAVPEHNAADGGVCAHPAGLQGPPGAEREPHHRARRLAKLAGTVPPCGQRGLPRPHRARAGRGGPSCGEAHPRVPHRCATLTLQPSPVHSKLLSAA